MRKFTIPAAALGVLTLAAMGASNPASAAPGAAFKGAAHAQTAPPDESDGTETADLPEAPEPAEIPEELPDQEDSEVAATADPESAPPDESDGTETADLPEAPEPAEVPEELPDEEDSEGAQGASRAAGRIRRDRDRRPARGSRAGGDSRGTPGPGGLRGRRPSESRDGPRGCEPGGLWVAGPHRTRQHFRSGALGEE